MNKTALGIFAHPDDAEFMCAGTLSLLRNEGWTIHIASLAKGDKGTNVLTKEEISSIRREEGIESANLLDGTYHCLEFDDVYIMYSRESINRTTGLIRKVRPSIVFTGSPNDYMLDHEITSMIVQTACFSCGIKNMDVEDEPFEPIPYLYFCDSMEGLDKFGKLIQPTIYINISSEIKTKVRMLSCHSSQRNWLLDHHKMDEFTGFVEDLGRLRGNEVDFDFAEGFRQCLGHSFPSENKLKMILGDLVITKDEIDIRANVVMNGNK